MLVGTRRIKREKLREDRYKERYARFLERKRVEGEGDNVKHMWEQVKTGNWLKAQEKCVA